MSRGGTKDPVTGFAIPTAVGIARTIGARGARIADRARNIRVRLGFRPYRVSLVLLRYTGGARDVGEPYEVTRHPVLPVPLLADLTGLAKVTTAGGADEIGTLFLSEVPMRYGENALRGLDSAGNPPEPDQKYLVEVVFTTGTEQARTFTVASAPTYAPTRFQWSMVLERSSVSDWLNRDGA